MDEGGKRRSGGLRVVVDSESMGKSKDSNVTTESREPRDSVQLVHGVVILVSCRSCGIEVVFDLQIL